MYGLLIRLSEKAAEEEGVCLEESIETDVLVRERSAGRQAE